QSAFAACRLPYAGAVPGCSRSLGPDCCLRQIMRGSTRSVPHGWFFRRGRVHSRYGLQLCFFSLRRSDLVERRRLTIGLLWRLARLALSPPGRLALHWARRKSNRPRRQAESAVLEDVDRGARERRTSWSTSILISGRYQRRRRLALLLRTPEPALSSTD